MKIENIKSVKNQDKTKKETKFISRYLKIKWEILNQTHIYISCKKLPINQ